MGFAVEILEMHTKEWNARKTGSRSSTETFGKDQSNEALNSAATDQLDGRNSGAVNGQDKDAAPCGYRFYTDHDGLVHNITVTRVDIRKNANERFQLRLYESEDTKIDTCYCVQVRYGGKVEQGSQVFSIMPTGSPFETARPAFELAFTALTGRKWQDRDFGTAMKKAVYGEIAETAAGVSKCDAANWPDLQLPAGMPSTESIIKRPFIYVKQGEQRPNDRNRFKKIATAISRPTFGP